MKETTIINQLFLELSQFATAKTLREIELEAQLKQWQQYAAFCQSCAVAGKFDVGDFNAFIARTEGLNQPLSPYKL